MSSEWDYFSFYFGNAVYPSDAIWRENRETGERQALVYATAGEESVEWLRNWWERVVTDRMIDPHYVTWEKRPPREGEDPNWYALRYWFTYPDEESALEAFDRDARIAGGVDASYVYESGTALYGK